LASAVMSRSVAKNRAESFSIDVNERASAAFRRVDGKPNEGERSGQQERGTRAFQLLFVFLKIETRRSLRIQC
jgi:hypothetical protein